MQRTLSNAKNKILAMLGISTKPVVKVYAGYGDANQLMICGHVLGISPLPQKKFSANIFSNTLAILRLFMVRPVSNAAVDLRWNQQSFETKTSSDGFFIFEWKPTASVTPGWHSVRVNYLDSFDKEKIIAEGEGQIFIPHNYQFAFISDIDDTFLISHSTNLRRRLFVLLTENAQSRNPFERVVNHYRLLAKAGATSDIPNPFFYVSSSEWNLYDYIHEFSRRHELPAGIYLLNQLKQLHEIIKTGQGNHSGKQFRIARILKTFPKHKYILLGDDGQNDPQIYSSIVHDFPDLIFAVYIRRISKSREAEVSEILKRMEASGVYSCYFLHSVEAIEHSRKIGLIS